MIVRLPGREGEDEIPNPLGGPTGVTVFETAHNLPICREFTSRSPVSSPVYEMPTTAASNESDALLGEGHNEMPAPAPERLDDR